MKLAVDHVYTHDRVEPVREGDVGFTYGWTCTPVPPTPDGGWETFDSSPDDKTGW